MRVVSYALAAALSLVAVEAHADPIVNISFSGTLGSGYDGGVLFGTPSSNHSMIGDVYTLVISYDPYQLTNDSCSGSSTGACTWNFGNSQEKDTLTINGVTQTFVGTSGTLSLASHSTYDYLQIIINGPGSYFQTTLNTTTSLFGGQSNVNSPTIINTASNIVLANQGGSGFTGNAAYNSTNFADYNILSHSDPVNAAVVPEPASLAVVAAGLFGLGAVRRRKQPAAI